MIAALVFPHQLFSEISALEVDAFYFIEEPLFFTQFPFHKKKLILHRASMKAKAHELNAAGKTVHYLNASESDVDDLMNRLQRDGIQEVVMYDVVDFDLEKKIKNGCRERAWKLTVLDSPQFFLSASEVKEEAKSKRYFLYDFYVSMRKRLGILLETDGTPRGGKWTFDEENRKKLPANFVLPTRKFPASNVWVEEATAYVNAQFENHTGEITNFEYAVDRSGAIDALQYFIDTRIQQFGVYQDAIHTDDTFLFHSVISPYINIGLLSPQECVSAVLASNAPLNSVEGFIRQIIGWREFMRMVYVNEGVKQRNRNFFNHVQPLPKGLSEANSGVLPLDNAMQKLLKHAYVHHIERLMVFGNFFLLAEVDPHEVYAFFMTYFIDAYDWVMVPNVYGMSQFADGGMLSTKPYFSGSNYVLEMSNFKKGDWSNTWDALFWNFVAKKEDYLAKNIRTSMSVNLWRKMDGQKKQGHMALAQCYFDKQHKN